MKRIGLAVASIAVGLLLVELVLRLTGFGLVTPELSFGVNTRRALEQGRFAADRELFWKLPARPTALDAAINAVHPDRPVPPRTGTRVLILGDSCSRLATEGAPYPAALQDRLGPRAEVLTAAVPGYTSHQGLVWLRRQLLAARPDLVVVYYGWNDHWRATGMTDREYARSLGAARPRLLSLLRRRPAIAPLRVPPGDYAENLAAIAAAVEARGGEVLFVRAPHHLTGDARGRLLQNGYIAAGDDPADLHRTHLAQLDAAAAAAVARVIDVAGAFAALGAGETLMHRDGIHLTTAGHEVMAAVLAERILGEHLGVADHDRPPSAVAAAALAAFTERAGGAAGTDAP